jgi:hypothetical protein
MSVTAPVRVPMPMPMPKVMVMFMVMVMPGMVVWFHWPNLTSVALPYVSCSTLRQLLERPHTPQRREQYACP